MGVTNWHTSQPFYPLLFLCRCTIANRTCLIDINYICNKTIQCETTDSEGNISILNPCDVGCATHYRCRNNQCHLRSTICDGSLNGCRDDEDEFEGGTGFKCIRKGKRCRIPQQMLWDDVADCDREADLCYILSTSTPTSSLVYRYVNYRIFLTKVISEFKYDLSMP